MPPVVRACQRLRDHTAFERFVLLVILGAGVLVGVETSRPIMEQHGEVLHLLDRAILVIFVLEILIKVVAEGSRPWRYFGTGWNVFDFSIVAACLLPAAGSWVAVIRLARVLRVLRVATQLQQLQVIVRALLATIPSMGYVALLLLMHFYIYAVIGVSLFRDNDPGHFGDLGTALLTLFRVVTLEDWTDVMYTAIQGSDVYAAQGSIPVGPEPRAFGLGAVAYFVSFVVVGAMVMVNLFIGVILTSITDAQAQSIKSKLDIDVLREHDEATLAELNKIEESIASLREQLATAGRVPPRS